MLGNHGMWQDDLPLAGIGKLKIRFDLLPLISKPNQYQAH